MTLMLSPDLLDRRALALLACVDPYGRPLSSAPQVSLANGANGLRVADKSLGRIAVIEAPGFAAFSSAFATQPGAPAARSRSIELLLTPKQQSLMPRRFTLRMPRNANPSNAVQPTSLFQPESIMFAATSGLAAEGTAALLRVTVTRAGDGALIGNALVRASGDGQTAWGVSDRTGTATLVFPSIPLSFSASGGRRSSTTTVAVIVDADPADVAARSAGAASVADMLALTAPLRAIDPDALADANPANFGGAPRATIGSGQCTSLPVTWTPP